MKGELPLVLVVDDEPEVTATIRRNLRGEPFELATTTSPNEALAIIERGEVDVLIADIDMPEMNGLSLVARVQRSNPEVIRILLTGDASLESAMTAINEGEVFRYLTKPWDTKALRETVRAALTRAVSNRRAVEASRQAAAREAWLAEVEERFPDLRAIVRDDGVYFVDAEALHTLTQLATDPRLCALFDAEATVGPAREKNTMRSAE